MPHCWEAVQLCVPGGTLRQLPETQNWPVLQVVLSLHADWQRPLLQVSFALH